MGLSESQKDRLKNVIKTSLRNKFLSYTPETTEMPFHYRLLGRDRMALYSFIQSLNTTFGTSIYEPAAVELAGNLFIKALRHHQPNNYIQQESSYCIDRIMNGIIGGNREPNKQLEKYEINSTLNGENLIPVRQTVIDIFVKDDSDNIYLFDIKTVKPNIGSFQGYKRTLLEWYASEVLRSKNKNIHTLIAIPYNPYEPKPYERWTLRGMFDLDEEIKVGKEFWDFLGGDGAYEVLLGCFETAGIELRPEIDEYFATFQYKH